MEPLNERLPRISQIVIHRVGSFLLGCVAQKDGGQTDANVTKESIRIQKMELSPGWSGRRVGDAGGDADASSMQRDSLAQELSYFQGRLTGPRC